MRLVPVTSARIIAPRDSRAVLIQRCRHWLNFPATVPTEAFDGHFLTVVGSDIAPGVANYEGVVVHGGMPDRAFDHAVVEADMVRALACTDLPEHAAGIYSRANPRNRGWYTAAGRFMHQTCGIEWQRWLDRPGWGCQSARCILMGDECTHPIDAVLRSCAEQMATALTVEWLDCG